jgi:CHAT domain-containing protein
VVLDDRFTVKAVTDLRGRWPLVLIMSHFEYFPGNSRKSTLVLGKGVRFSLAEMQKHPGLFTGVELLILSACETATQEPNADGKEVDGFTELAQRLGASTVIATQWSIFDQATSRLMIDFFRQHREHPNWSKAQLLRQTQLDFLTGKVSFAPNVSTGKHITTCRVGDPSARTFVPNPDALLAHPFYWSAFVLYGQPR